MGKPALKLKGGHLKMFLETIEKIFIGLPYGGVVTATIHTTTAVTPYQATTITETTIEFGDIVLIETVVTVEFPNGLVMMAIERGILIPVYTRPARANVTDELAARRELPNKSLTALPAWHN